MMKSIRKWPTSKLILIITDSNHTSRAAEELWVETQSSTHETYVDFCTQLHDCAVKEIDRRIPIPKRRSKR